MIDVFKKIDGDRIKSLGYVGRLAELMPTGYQLKLAVLSFRATPKAREFFFLKRRPITSADRRMWNLISAFSLTSLSSVFSDPMLFDIREPSTGLGSSAWAKVKK